MPCFWTDKTRVTETCDEGGGGDNHVDALVYLGQLYDTAVVGDWIWDGSPLYAPAAPGAPIAGSWLTGFGPATAINYVRNTTILGSTTLDNADFVLDYGLGRAGTNGNQSIPVVDSIGGSGPYSASGFFIYTVGANLDPVGIYDALPSEYRYPSWADECIAIPRRREMTKSRALVNVDLAFGGSVTELGVYTTPGDFVYSGPGVTTINETSAEADHSSTDIGPWGEFQEVSLGLKLSIKPSGLGPVDIDGYIQPEVFVTAPGLIDAYVDGIEFFALEDPNVNATHDWPSAGTGVAVPGFRIPVCYDEGSGYWYIGQSLSMFENPDPPALPSGDGGFVGTLRSAADDTEICRVAVLRYSGGS